MLLRLVRWLYDHRLIVTGYGARYRAEPPHRGQIDSVSTRRWSLVRKH